MTQSGVDPRSWPATARPPFRLQFFIQAGSDCSDKRSRVRTGTAVVAKAFPTSRVSGVSGQGRGALTRSSEDARPWTIGGSSDTDVIEHAFVAYDAESGRRRMRRHHVRTGRDRCSGEGSRPSNDTPCSDARRSRASCLGQMIVRDNEHLSRPKALTACVEEHCQLDACVATCADYLACTTQADDRAPPRSCGDRLALLDLPNYVQSCSLSFCADQLTCAAP